MYIMERTIKDWKVTYKALNPQGIIDAKIEVVDGKYEKYIIVPIIKSISGNEAAMIFLLNWITVKIKGPIVAYIRPQILIDYGFEKKDDHLVWREEKEAII